MKKIFGLLGKNINYSFSPQLHKEIFNFLNCDCDCDYKIFDIKENEIKIIIEKIKKEEIQGINITIPYKQTVMKYLDEISENAEKIGAVNTVYKKNGKLIGENTDYWGFLKTLEKMKINLQNKTVAVLGTGGSAKAVIQVIKNLGGNPVIVSRTPEKTASQFKNFNVINYNELKNIQGELIVNCTPLGNKNYPTLSPVNKIICQNWKTAVDLNYTPEISVFLSYFADKPHSNGLYMLVAQGIQSEAIWQGKNISIDEIYNKVYNNVYKKITKEF